MTLIKMYLGLHTPITTHHLITIDGHCLAAASPKKALVHLGEGKHFQSFGQDPTCTIFWLERYCNANFLQLHP